MEYFTYINFTSSIIKLSLKGGPYSKAANTADSLVGKVTRGDSNPLHGLQRTNYGESRIEHCVKYDLCGRSRLVTVQTKGRCLLLYVGDHKTVDKWLDSNKGITFALNSDNKLEEVKSRSTIIGNGPPTINGRLKQPKFLFELLDEDIYDRLVCNVQPKICRKLEKLQCFDEKTLYEVVSEETENQRKCILDVFLALIAGDISGAEKCIQYYLGDLISIEDIDVETAIIDSEFLRKVSVNSSKYPHLLRRFAEESDYKEWMLFMHPDQEAAAFNDFNGSSKLLGVSGSGKTCVVIHRAIYLANKYPGKKILVLTLNKPLAALIKNLVIKIVDPEFSHQIEVQPFFQICQNMLRQFEPSNEKLYEDVTWKSAEHIDEVWREFYRCELGNNDASILTDIHDSLISRGIDAEHYIKEEFDWIRSACPQDNRTKYLSMSRQGRTVPLLEKSRKQLLEGLKCWEKKMADVGVTDYLNISTALYTHLDLIESNYRCVLIDESQDFGNIEFSIVRKLVEQNENDIFLSGDAAQQISTKYQRPKEVGIILHSSRSKTLTRNYRNSREILELAHSILMKNLSEKMLESDDFEILEPEYASFLGANPLLLQSNSLEEEVSSSIHYINTQLNANQKACICISGFSQREIKMFADSIDYPVLDGNIDITDDQIFISDLEQTKGFEFDYMCILNCVDGVIPDPLVPEDEHFRELSRLYVAMTRAKLELILSYSNNQSSLFDKSDDYFIPANWSEYVDDNIKSYGQPEKLSEVVHIDDIITEHPLEMTGKEFLYRKEAINLKPSLVDFIRNNIDGHGKVIMGSNQSKRRIKWRKFRDLFDDITGKTPYIHKLSKEMLDDILDLKLLMEKAI